MGLGLHTSTKLPSEVNADGPETLNLLLLENFLLESAQRGGDALPGGAVKGQTDTVLASLQPVAFMSATWGLVCSL